MHERLPVPAVSAEKVYENGENSINSAGELRKLQGECAFFCLLPACLPAWVHTVCPPWLGPWLGQPCRQMLL